MGTFSITSINGLQLLDTIIEASYNLMAVRGNLESRLAMPNWWPCRN
jgi:pyruvate kinase